MSLFIMITLLLLIYIDLFEKIYNQNVKSNEIKLKKHNNGKTVKPS